MKEIKVQQDVLALAQTPHRVRFGRLNDGRMGVTIDSFAAYIIYSDNVFLDTRKFQTIDLQKIFDDIYNAKDIQTKDGKVIVKADTLLQEMISDEKGVSILKLKDTLKEFKNDDTTAYFNEKLFKYFDSKKKLTYSYHKTKLFVFENGELVGVVLESRVKK